MTPILFVAPGVVKVKAYSESVENTLFDLSIGHELHAAHNQDETSCARKEIKGLVSAYMLAKFNNKKAEKRYVGCMTQHDGKMKELEVSILRKVPRTATECREKSVDVYSEKEDKVWMNEDLIEILPVPTVNNRGRVHFPITLENE